MYTWYGRGEEEVYRFFSDVDLRNVHFSGILKGSELLHIPNWIRKILEIKV